MVLLGWLRRATPGATALALAMLASAEWSFFAAFEVAAVDLPAKILWGKIAYVGVCGLPTLWLMFALSYSRDGRSLSKRAKWLLSIWPVLTFLMAATNEWHGLVWPSVTLSPDIATVVYTHGPWVWMNTAYSYTLMLISTACLLVAVIRHPGPFRRQSVALVLGSLPPWVGSMVYVFGLSPVRGLDVTPFMFTLAGLIVAWGVYRLELFDLTPVARDALVENLNDGMLVLDDRGRVVDINPAAQRMFGLRAEEVLGQPVNNIFGRWEDLAAALQQADLTRAEVYVEQIGHLALRASPIRRRNGQNSGRVVILVDITQRLETQRQLQEAYGRLEQKVAELQEALDAIKALSGLVPICGWCGRKIRNQDGDWVRVETYLAERTGAAFTHGICPECQKAFRAEATRDRLM